MREYRHSALTGDPCVQRILIGKRQIIDLIAADAVQVMMRPAGPVITIPFFRMGNSADFMQLLQNSQVPVDRGKLDLRSLRIHILEDLLSCRMSVH